jgi:hypothetical protein
VVGTALKSCPLAIHGIVSVELLGSDIIVIHSISFGLVVY